MDTACPFGQSRIEQRSAPDRHLKPHGRGLPVPAERLSTKLRRLRLSAGLTQHETARRAGISVGMLRDLEQGRTTTPRKASLAELAGERTPAIRVNILGPFELLVDGAPTPVGGHKQALILGMLALHANEYVPRDELAEYVWGTHRPVEYAALLYSYVARLRKRLATAAGIVSSRQRYQLTLSPECLDATALDGATA